MSKLRPELGNGKPGDFTLTGVTAYLAILKAVEQQPHGLIHGKLHQGQLHCAIGSYFEINKPCLYENLIDEVAAVNDSVPRYGLKQRQRFVIQWLRWKLRSLGMPLVGRPTKEKPKP